MNIPPPRRSEAKQTPDWEQRRYDLIKSAMPGIIGLMNNKELILSAMEFKNTTESPITTTIAAVSIQIVDKIIEQLKIQRNNENT